MKYPTRTEVELFIASDLSASPHASAAEHWGVSWFEIADILWSGRVRDETKDYWNMVRRECGEMVR